MTDDFYVGYQPQASRSMRRWMAFTWLVIGAGAAFIGIALTAGQTPPAPARFEFGRSTEFEGAVELWPYPMLRVAGARLLLVLSGKYGADEAVRPFAGRQVTLRGSLIEREGIRMVEIEPASLTERGPALPDTADLDLGAFSLTGEVVDTKCYLGVMNPGQGVPHRGCAQACLRGGIPAALLVRDSAGVARLVLLAGAEGRPLSRQVAHLTAQPATFQGRLLKSGGWFTLRTGLPATAGNTAHRLGDPSPWLLSTSKRRSTN
ncbi:MAG: hypothetical protein FJW40_04840 [Acidobacteria bacterium]|nr:hypothetical protein [Acidobacteriota bacterium]